MSYLAYPVKGKLKELTSELQCIPECEIFLAENRDDVLIIVTDTVDQAAQDNLFKKLENIASLQCLALASAFSDPEIKQSLNTQNEFYQDKEDLL